MSKKVSFSMAKKLKLSTNKKGKSKSTNEKFEILLKYKSLLIAIEKVHKSTQHQAIQSVNIVMTLRNWVIGYYIVEYEQNGEDRAKYGKKLLNFLAKGLKEKKLRGFSVTNLRLYRLFYCAYPQIRELLLKKHQDGESIFSEHICNLLTNKEFSIHQAVTDELKKNKPNPYSPKLELILQSFTFTHFIELIKIKDLKKRAFYEIQGIQGNWSVRQLKRQIDSLLFERVGLSKNKTILVDKIHSQNENLKVEDAIRDPYILEFVGLQEQPEYSEVELETALLNHIQEFLLELGDGFCFEARQKRITVDDEHDRVDLVFYHRILKCHILIDLKVRKFSHADAGQMNFYLNYFKENIMTTNDNDPVGLILCTSKTTTKVRYAISGMDNKLFVSKYLISLPSEKELEDFIIQDRDFIERGLKGF